MKAVITKFVNRVQQKQAKTANTNSQSKYIDKGKALLFGKVSPGDFNVVF
jgi:hypothetical protein